jgi:hypothetical protein
MQVEGRITLELEGATLWDSNEEDHIANLNLSIILSMEFRPM